MASKILSFIFLSGLVVTPALAQDDALVQILRSNLGMIEGTGSNGSACLVWVENKRNGKMNVSYGDMFGQYEARYPVRAGMGNWILNAEKNEMTFFPPYDKSVTFKYDEDSYLIRQYAVIVGGKIENKCRVR